MIGPMSGADKTARTREYYDALGEQEWDRLTKDVPGRVAFEVHRRFLAEHLSAGDRVLEIGAGPGRFTAELAALGARVVVTDLSPVQLELNRRHLAGTPAEAAVERRELVDVRDLSRARRRRVRPGAGLRRAAVLHVRGRGPGARGMLRVVRPGGRVLGSVMSALGAWRYFFAGVTALAESSARTPTTASSRAETCAMSTAHTPAGCSVPPR